MIYPYDFHREFTADTHIFQCTLEDIRDCEVYVHSELFDDAFFFFRLIITQDGVNEDDKQSRNVLDRYIIRPTFICDCICAKFTVGFRIDGGDLSKERCLKLAGIENFMTKPRERSVYRKKNMEDLIDELDDGEETAITFSYYSKE